MVNEVGIIGQMYESRRSKKIGVIESRNDKYRTLMMRAPDGNSFTITYSTFKSDWRKYQGNEVAETSTQVEEKREKVKKAEEKLEKPAKTEKIKISRSEKVEASGALYDLVSSIVEKSEGNLSVKLNSKGGVIVRRGHKTVCGAWVSDIPGIYSLYTNLDMSSSDVFKDAEFEHRDNWKLKNRYRMKNIKEPVIATINQYVSMLEEKEEDK